MASISKVFIEAMKVSLQEKPLQPEELRKIPCLGSYHVSLLDHVKGHEPIACIKSGGQDVYLYRISISQKEPT